MFAIVTTDKIKDNDSDFLDGFGAVLAIRAGRDDAIASAETHATALAKDFAEENGCRATWRRIIERGGVALALPRYQLLADKDPWDDDGDDEGEEGWDGRDDDPDQPVDDLVVCDIVVGEVLVIAVTDVG